MPPIYWTPNGPAAGPNNLGIGIPDPPTNPNFQAQVNNALINIHNNSLAGQQLLTNIINITTPMGAANPIRVGINPGPNNQCASMPQPGTPQDQMTRLARAVIANNAANTAIEITNSLNALGLNNPAGRAAVAAQINMIPNYQLVGPVAGNPVQFGVTAAHVNGWATGANAFPAPLAPANLDALKHALLIVLQPGMTAGTGCSSRVNWNPTINGITIGGVFTPRPAHVGLAHELIHAYNDMMGLQIGIDFGAPSTVLYEYMCVGLGPWANPANLAALPNPPLTENSIRALSGVPLRPQYG
ncbi:MAG: M91 family zinc metallopeptidase [Potamolinea sp.]